MKKRINFRKLGRTPTHKWAMLRNMVTSLIEHERIVTTLPKAKEVQSLAEKLITMSKNEDSLHGRRQANKIVRTAAAQTKLMNVLGPRYEFRQGGYTRIMKLANARVGDKADMAVIEYVDRPGEIRAARPPSAFVHKTLEEVMAELGISSHQMQYHHDEPGDVKVEEKK
jgi:large subunit ribosomal protein L17